MTTNGMKRNRLFIVIYNPTSEKKSTELFNVLRRTFGQGAIAKKDVYLIALQEDEDMEDIRKALDSVIEIGESVMILKIGDKISSKGYPANFHEWLRRQKE